MHVVIVGGGVIGLATAWRSLTSGIAVTVVDPEPASKASYVSAGLLPAVNELLYDREHLLRLCLASRDRYPSFIAELQAVSGVSAGYRRDGFLDLAFDADGLAMLDRLRRIQESLDIASEVLTGKECRSYEAKLAPSVLGGLLSPDDGSIDPRRLMTALLTAIERLGGKLIRDRVTDVLIDDRANGVRLRSGDIVPADRVVLAAGCWTHDIDGLPLGVVPQIRPVKGQILRLRSDPPLLRRAARGLMRGRSVYLAPRADGELVIGATYEMLGYDTTVTAGGAWELLSKARAMLPDLDHMAFAEFTAGLRPGSPDDLPLLGETLVPDLLLATGHCRIGIQLAPVTADSMTELLLNGEFPAVAKPFAVSRFHALTS